MQLIRLLQSTISARQIIVSLLLVNFLCVFEILSLRLIYKFFSDLNEPHLTGQSIIAIISILFTTNVFRLLALYFTQDIAESVRKVKLEQLFNYIKYQPQNNIDEMFFVNELDNVVQTVVNNLATVMISVLTAIYVSGYLLYTYPTIGALGMSTVAFGYVLAYTLTRPILQRFALQKIVLNKKRIRDLQDIRGIAWSMKGVTNLTTLTKNSFDNLNSLKSLYRNAYVIAQMPRFVVEFLVLTGVMLVAVALSTADADLLSIFALLGLSALKIVPGIQSVFFLIANLKYNNKSLSYLNQPQLMVEIPLEKFETGLHRVSIAKLRLGDIRNIRSENVVTINISKGQILKISGPSGAGKSTLLKALINRTLPEVAYQSADQRPVHCKIAYATQDSYMLDGTVKDNITVLSELNSSKVTDIQTLEFLGLDQHRGMSSDDLSGGEKQRVQILRVLASDADILILDEPFSAIDQNYCQKIDRLINSVRDKFVIIYTSHNFNITNTTYEIEL